MKARRRLLVAAAAWAAATCLAAPPPSRRQPWRIGWLSPVRARHRFAYGEDFVPGMRSLGYGEGRDFVAELRYADGRYERLPVLARELVSLGMDLLLTTASNATRAAQGVTRTIPIVFVSVNDPVSNGIVESLSRPGGNTTGIANFTGDLIGKHIELLRTVLARLERIAVLVNLLNPSNARILERARAAAERSALEVLPLNAKDEPELEDAFARAAGARCDAIVVASDPFLFKQAPRIAELALRHRLPSVFGLSYHVESGGLMSYGDDVFKIYRRAAVFVDKIFNGAHPGELPVEQPVDFELAVNLKTAAALGVGIPRSLLLRAEKVIE